MLDLVLILDHLSVLLALFFQLVSGKKVAKGDYGHCKPKHCNPKIIDRLERKHPRARGLCEVCILFNVVVKQRVAFPVDEGSRGNERSKYLTDKHEHDEQFV